MSRRHLLYLEVFSASPRGTAANVFSEMAVGTAVIALVGVRAEDISVHSGPCIHEYVAWPYRGVVADVFRRDNGIRLNVLSLSGCCCRGPGEIDRRNRHGRGSPFLVLSASTSQYEHLRMNMFTRKGLLGLVLRSVVPLFFVYFSRFISVRWGCLRLVHSFVFRCCCRTFDEPGMYLLRFHR